MDENETDATAVDDVLTEDGADVAGDSLGRGAAASIGERLRAAVERDEAAALEPDPEDEQAATMPPDPYTAACPTCHGYGTTYTGSRVEAHLFRDCPTCQALGYVLLEDAHTGPQPGEQRTVTYSETAGWKWSA